jgi:hypothetical protein
VKTQAISFNLNFATILSLTVYTLDGEVLFLRKPSGQTSHWYNLAARTGAMETETQDAIQVILQISPFERIDKIKNQDGTYILSHQYCKSDGHWHPCCPPVSLATYTDERALFVIQRCPHYGKRDGQDILMPALHKSH